MADGITTSGSLSAALPSIIVDARIVREYEGVWQRTCEMKKLAKGSGLAWQEFTLQQVAGQDISETTINENPQMYTGVLQSSIPQLSQIMIEVTDRTMEKIATVVTSKFGTLAGNAMKRKKDEDYLSLFAGFATTASPGTGNPLSFGHITAAVSNATSNDAEGVEGNIFAVLHGFQVKDIQDEILQGVGTYTIPTGMTQDVFKQGFSGSIANANVFIDNNIARTSTPDAFGAVHARMGVVGVQGAALKTETRRMPDHGGGSDQVFITDDYSFVERTSAGTQAFCYLIRSDATQPTA